MAARKGHASAEDVLSGRGIEAIYAWHAFEAGGKPEKSAADIMAAMEAGADPLAAATVATFVALMGRFIGDLALVHLPFGGIYLIGGVTRSMAPYFTRMEFPGTLPTREGSLSSWDSSRFRSSKMIMPP